MPPTAGTKLTQIADLKHSWPWPSCTAVESSPLRYLGFHVIFTVTTAKYIQRRHASMTKTDWQTRSYCWLADTVCWCSRSLSSMSLWERFIPGRGGDSIITAGPLNDPLLYCACCCSFGHMQNRIYILYSIQLLVRPTLFGKQCKLSRTDVGSGGEIILWPTKCEYKTIFKTFVNAEKETRPSIRVQFCCPKACSRQKHGADT